MANTKFSIVIPAYNYAHFLPRALDSILENLTRITCLQNFLGCYLRVLKEKQPVVNL